MNELANVLFNKTTAGYVWDLKTEKRLNNPLFLEQYGYKVYSQNDEDGIIHEIFNRIGVTNKKFIEFGVQDGLESNCHCLLHYGWTGLWIEGDKDFYNLINKKFGCVIQTGQLKVVSHYIDRENVNDIFWKNGFTGEIDLLSIDIDGNDYHVWKAISCVKPRVVVIEYNAKFPPDLEWVMPYNKEHMWNGSDQQGASLKAYEKLGNLLGYQLVATNITGVNAFFVRNDLTEDKFFRPATSENLYNPARFNDIKFVSGHPSDVCLKYEKEGIEGVFDFKDNGLGFVCANGFYGIEHDGDNGIQFQWMREKEAKIYFRTKYEKPQKLEIQFFNKVDDMEVAVKIGSGQWQNFNELQIGRNIIETVIANDYSINSIIEINIKINQLWTPKDKGSQTDDRVLGIAIENVSVCERKELDDK